VFKDVGQLVIKYLNELETPTMPDGSPHPDYLSEANFLAELEYLETRDYLPEPELQAAKKADAITEESDRFILTWYAKELVKLVNAGDHAAIQDFVNTVLRPMRIQVTQGMCVFRSKPATDSTAKLPPIPGESCHRFR